MDNEKKQEALKSSCSDSELNFMGVLKLIEYAELTKKELDESLEWSFDANM